MLHRITLLAALLVTLGARAEEPSQKLHFVAYATGLRVLDIGAAFDLDPDGYRIDMTVRTVGLFGALVDGDSHAVARGVWRGAAAIPVFYDSRGRWRGENRQTTIDYVDGQPVIRALLPTNDREREPVAPALQANTLDSLSAMAVLVRLVAVNGRCDGAARVFDGRRLSEITVHTVGQQELPPTGRSSFTGQALRCEFDGRLLAGFRYEDDRARAARPQHGVAWLAAMAPGGPMLPVRIQFATRFFGDATMYLQP